MSSQKLGPGRCPQIDDPKSKKKLSANKVLGLPSRTYKTKKESDRVAEEARVKLRQTASEAVTLAQFHARWTTEPQFATRKASTELHNRERTTGFVKRYGDLPIADIDHRHVAEWLADGKNKSTVPALRVMFNEAGSAKAGCLVANNPFARLGLRKGPGRRDRQPPGESTVWALVNHARKLGGPGFAGWLQTAAFTGMRPAELDALRWERVDFDRHRILVREQFCAKTRTFTLPKNNQVRETPLTEQARAALLALPQTSEFCFVPLRSEHFTASSRAYHWKAVRAAVGWKEELYLAPRHFAGWYMVNQLGMVPEDVAIALGHSDGGNLVRTLYGHRDRDLALNRVVEAYADAVREARQQ